MRWIAVPFVLMSAGAGAAADPLQAPATAEVCGRCHRAIYEGWKKSAHARALEGRQFQDALEAARAAGGARVERLCLGCHAPVAELAGDLALRLKVSWEGITCDYCHSLRNVRLEGSVPKAQVEFGSVRTGPLQGVEPGVHGARFSAVHQSALACAPCHEYRNALGFPVMTTYSEWMGSASAKEGKTCQTCHMYAVAGHVVEPRIQRTQEAKINLHLMPGSQSLEQLTRAVGATLSAVRDKDQVRVSVEVSNRSAGHHVPTGTPLRQLLLEVTADSYDGQRFREERSYRRDVADSKGVTLTQEHAAFLRAAQLVSDTRLAPGENRTEAFIFPVPTGVAVQVKVALRYYFSPPVARPEAEQRVTFLTLQRLVR